jgi:hypothetical protein
VADINAFEQLNPLLLYKDDLLELEGLIRRDMDIKGDNYHVTITVDDPKVSAQRFDSFADVYGHLPLKRLKCMSIDAREHDDSHNVDKHVTFFLTDNFIEYRLHTQDENWFRAKKELLDRFFKQHRPWYWWLSKTFPVVANVMVIISFLLLHPVIKTGNLKLLVLPGMLFTYASLLMVLGLARRIYPTGRIHFVPRDQVPNKGLETVMLWTGVIVFPVAVGGGYIYWK